MTFTFLPAYCHGIYSAFGVSPIFARHLLRSTVVERVQEILWVNRAASGIIRCISSGHGSVSESGNLSYGAHVLVSVQRCQNNGLSSFSYTSFLRNAAHVRCSEKDDTTVTLISDDGYPAPDRLSSPRKRSHPGADGTVRHQSELVPTEYYYHLADGSLRNIDI